MATGSTWTGDGKWLRYDSHAKGMKRLKWPVLSVFIKQRFSQSFPRLPIAMPPTRIA
jgi:hypothetical protein